MPMHFSRSQSVGLIFLAVVTLAVVSLTGSTVQACFQENEPTAEDMFTAAQMGDLQAVQAALEAGVDANSKTKYLATALSFAAEKGHIEIVKALIEAGADPNVKDTFYNATPLTWANMGKHKEVAKFLKENGAELPTFKRRDDTKKKTDKKKDAKDAEKEVRKAVKKEEKPDWGPSSDESRMADRQVSKDNWPGFRGTGARGIADGQNPPVNWNAEKESNLLWKTAIDGLGHSCPVVFGDRIYITTAISEAGDTSIKPGNYGGVDSVKDESEHSYQIVCVNKNDGAILWKKEAAKGVPKVKRHLKSTHANCTVATDGKHVVAFFAGEGLFCYSSDGELLWKRDLGMLDSGWFYDKSYQWGFGSSPTIFEDKVIVQCDVQEQSFIASLNLKDGSEVWRTDRDEIPSWSSPTVADTPRGPMVLTTGTGFARGYDARTGGELWKFKKFSEIVVPTPFVAHDLIYLTSGYSPIQPVMALKMSATGDVTLPQGETSSDHVQWYLPRGGPYMPTPIVYGDYMYICSNDGRLQVLDAKTGKRVYRVRLNDGADQLHEEGSEEEIETGTMSFVGSPVAADGKIYFTSEYGYTFVLKAGPEFKMVAINSVGENVLTTAAISQGVMFVRGQEHLFALKQKKENE